MPKEDIPSLEQLCEEYGRGEEREEDGRFAQAVIARKTHEIYGRGGLVELATRYRKSLATLFVRAKVGSLLHLRNPLLTYGHFAVVAWEKNPEEWLQQCTENEWTLRQLRQEIANSKSAPLAPDSVVSAIGKWIAKSKNLCDDAKAAGVLEEYRQGLATITNYLKQN